MILYSDELIKYYMNKYIQYNVVFNYILMGVLINKCESEDSNNISSIKSKFKIYFYQRLQYLYKSSFINYMHILLFTL